MLICLTLPLASCGSRSVSTLDGPASADSTTTAPDRSLVAADACLLPSGYCELGSNTCPKGFACQGCYACKGLAYYRCGCQEIVSCAVCSSCIGRCLPDICGTNKDCPSDHFCNVDGHCVITGGIAGRCEPRPDPQDCPDYMTCPKVCGCDGKTYCDECDAHDHGISIAHSGACLAATCAGLDAAYVGEVKQAKQCCPTCKSLQCQHKVADRLACGCETYINTPPTAAMKALQAEWGTRGCNYSTSCPPSPCELVVDAGCKGSGSSGLCQDYYAD